MKNLTEEQLQKLVDKQIICKGVTRVTIEKISKNDLDEYIVNGIYKKNDSLVFSVVNVHNGYKTFIKPRFIKSIDGMNAVKLFEAYNIDDNEPVEVNDETNVYLDLVGKPSATINGISVKDGMRFVFNKDCNRKYCQRVLKVRFVNGVINLVANRGRPRKIRAEK